jgi:hypothetical protein
MERLGYQIEYEEKCYPREGGEDRVYAIPVFVTPLSGEAAGLAVVSLASDLVAQGWQARALNEYNMLNRWKGGVEDFEEERPGSDLVVEERLSA